ncbi:Oidioi.mRNA.OKI2018_I69.chr1.g635.t1.cds [Oikopleura dioica]|uniref:Oidioi.mRNA.OKI2018_I69.chr1.g635.t1.cds n=1 Tax=Oikopleura dioica TaxID=34765 RepID=A0ABN7SKG8_OIKDI|nr:Oidioi.mRNA.OKI2018_I69.chr1.g635.t1.cds [Oikopleura dioica]
MIKVINTDKLHRGIYLRASVNGTIVYQSARKEGKMAKARIQFGDLGEGNMWYASILFGDNYAAYYGRGFYAWVKDSGNEKCPPPTKLEGNGGEIVCFHGILKDPY